MAAKTPQANLTIKTSLWRGILLENYTYTPGAVEPLPKHSHHEYQLGLSLNCPGEYFYRGAYHPIPIGNLSIIHSGEVHSPSQRTYLSEPATFWMMHVDPSVLEATALEMSQKPANLPFFTEPVLSDRLLSKQFQTLCTATQSQVTRLEREAVTLKFLARFVTYHRKLAPEIEQPVKPAITLVCDFLQAHYHEEISLAQLAAISRLSRFYLSRLFHRQMGMTLSAYQLQIRVDRAKKLLAKGVPIAQVASTIGFYDQSHFGYHFKRLVGTTPGKYQRQ